MRLSVVILVLLVVGPPQHRAMIAEYVARLASGVGGIEEPGSRVLPAHVLRAIRNVGFQLREERPGGLFCAICHKGPFTRKGYYLHLTRVHHPHLVDLVYREAERIASRSKHVGA